jgi:hypothetical protein
MYVRSWESQERFPSLTSKSWKALQCLMFSNSASWNCVMLYALPWEDSIVLVLLRVTITMMLHQTNSLGFFLRTKRDKFLYPILYKLWYDLFLLLFCEVFLKGKSNKNYVSPIWKSNSRYFKTFSRFSLSFLV